jgi:hypothetical protein
LPIAREVVSREHNGVVIVGQDVLNLFLKTASCQLHCHTGELIQPFFTPPRPCYRTATGDVEAEIVRAGLKIAIHVAAQKRCVSLSDRRFK